MNTLDLIGLVSAHTGNTELDNTLTIYDWIIGLPIRLILIFGLIFSVIYLIKNGKRKKDNKKN